MNRSRPPLQRVPTPAAIRNGWCEITAKLADGSAELTPFITAWDETNEQLGQNIYMRARRQAGPTTVFSAIYYLPDDVAELRLEAFGTRGDTVRVIAFACTPITVNRAALRLLAPRPALALRILAGTPCPAGLRRRLRAAMVRAAHAYFTIAEDYATWIRMFDDWPPDAIPPPASPLSIAYLVVAQAPSSAARSATMASLEAQHGPAVTVMVQEPNEARPLAGIDTLHVDYIGILQAGEVLPPHATLAAASELDRLGRPDIALTDEDRLDEAGERGDPSFKPVPNQAMMLSGVLSRGLWLVRSTLLAADTASVTSAEALRLRLWLDHRLHATPARLPYILCHRHPDTETESPAVLAQVVADRLRADDPPIVPQPHFPLTYTLGAASWPSVAAIVPSTLRGHAARCILAVLDGTDYADFSVHVGVSQPGPLDSVQHDAASRIEAAGRATVTHLPAARFNFSWVNNQLFARTRSEYVLLLNDDVSPINADWLRWLAAFLRDPGVGITGARLLYPSGDVQHGGVIMGMGGLCDHAHRGLPRDAPGYMSRAVVAQQLSAVTAACMLVRRSALDRVGGLDEAYPSAFNDVDFALRVGELGLAVIYVPQAELTHHEMQTYGESHYGGDRAAFHAAEVTRMRRRWRGVVQDDPFHNPNLGLATGLEWSPAFPPRPTA